VIGSPRLCLQRHSHWRWVADLEHANGRLGLILSRLTHMTPDGLNHQGAIAVVFDADSLELLQHHGQTSGHSWDNVLNLDAESHSNEALILWELWGPSHYQETYAMSVRPDGTVVQPPVALNPWFRLNRRDDLFDHAGDIYAVAGAGAKRQLILNILVRGE